VGIIPSDLSGLYHWQKISALSQAEGSEITTWPDSSGSGRTGTGNTGASSKPIFRSNRLAGYGSADLVPGNLSTVSIGSSSYADLAANTKFIVFKPYPYGAVYGGLYNVGVGGGGSEALWWYGSADQTLYERAWWAGYARGPGAACSESVWHYACGWQTNRTTGEKGVSVDGGTEVTRARDGFDTYPTAGGVMLGVDGGAYSCAEVAEFFMFNRVLSGSERTSMNAYLRDRYFSVSSGQQEQIRDTISRRLWLLRRWRGSTRRMRRCMRIFLMRWGCTVRRVGGGCRSSWGRRIWCRWWRCRRSSNCGGS
jgi:hypothetical protein